jgi:hypothetical protein
VDENRPDEEQPDPLASVRAERDRHGQALADGVIAALPGWVERCVASRLPPGQERAGVTPALVAAASAEAVEEARVELTASVQRVPGEDSGPTPLQVVRTLVRHPTMVLAALGVAPTERTPFERGAFPDDTYGLAPAAWTDIDPAVHDAGIAWGAATAHLHKQLHATD